MQSTETVVIVGAGWTGRQIAGQMLAFGLRVLLCDPQKTALEASREWILKSLEPFASEGYWPKSTAQEITSNLELRELDRLVQSPPPPGTIELVLESVPEQAALKRRVLKELSETFRSETILASNSSYFVPSTFSRHVRSPDRYAHFHFHVPIWMATLVDVATAPETSQETVDRLIALADRIGQTPLVQRVENTGYVFNWMLKSLLQSALQLAALIAQFVQFALQAGNLALRFAQAIPCVGLVFLVGR